MTSEKEKKLDEVLERHKIVCANALLFIEQKGKKVAEFLRDKVTYKN